MRIAIARDLRFGFRLLSSNPRWTAFVTVSLALVVGANAALFSLIDVVLLRPFLYRDPERIVLLWNTSDGSDQRGLSGPELVKLQAQTSLFESVLPFVADPRSDSGAGPRAAYVDARLLQALGTAPLLGRLPQPEDAAPAAADVAVISYPLWVSQFSARSESIGETVTAGGSKYVIVGVMPKRFFFPDQDVRVWCVLRPTTYAGVSSSDVPLFHAVGRLAQDMSLEQAQRTVGGLTPASRATTQALARTRLFPIRHLAVDRYETALWAFQGGLGALLVVACLNAGTLIAARTRVRGPELRTRLAVGATPGALVRQLTTEVGLMSMLVAVVSIPCAQVYLYALKRADATGLLQVYVATLSPRVLFVLVLMAVASLFASQLFALLMTRPQWLSSRRAQSSFVPGWNRVLSYWNVTIVTQIALSLVIFIGAALMMRSFVRIGSARWGFDPESVLIVETQLPSRMRSQPDLQDQFAETVLTRLRANQTVLAAAVAYGVPVKWGGWASTAVGIDGALKTKGWSTARWTVGPGYFSALRIPIVEGRELRETDGRLDKAVIIVSESAARRLWYGGSPIGKSLRLLKLRSGPDGKPLAEIAARIQRHDPALSSDQNAYQAAEATEREVVGVVGDVKMRGLDALSEPAIYVSYKQPVLPVIFDAGMYSKFVVRTANRPETLATFARSAVLAAATDLDALEIVPLSSLVGQSVAGLGSSRLLQLVASWFSIAGLTVVGLGVYGVSSYGVTERRREMALRIALGADNTRLRKHFLNRGLSLASVGLIIGATLALFATRLLKSYLFEVAPTDPMVFVASASIVGAIAVLAFIVPARHIAPVNPAAVLRHE